MGWEPPELAGLLQGAAPHPRYRLLILPAAQQFRLGVAFSSLVSMVAAHTAPPSCAACSAVTSTAWEPRLSWLSDANCCLALVSNAQTIELAPLHVAGLYAPKTKPLPRYLTLRWAIPNAPASITVNLRRRIGATGICPSQIPSGAVARTREVAVETSVVVHPVSALRACRSCDHGSSGHDGQSKHHLSHSQSFPFSFPLSFCVQLSGRTLHRNQHSSGSPVTTQYVCLF